MPTALKERFYDRVVREHFAENRQMLFLSGPRQCGKTTIAKSLSDVYLNWDDSSVRTAVLAGQKTTVERFGLDRLADRRLVVAFDEIHKYPRWKGFLKGLFDVYGDPLAVIATGSAKMNVYKRGGDSLMGRYFPYRMHPLSVAELLDTSVPGEGLVRPPRPLPDTEWRALIEFGGFPEPFVRRDRRFSNRWAALRFEQMMLDDVRTFTQVQELEQIRLLAEILSRRSGEQLVWNSLAADVSADPKSAKKWTAALEHLYFGFLVRPWTRNVSDSIRKTPKWYLRDWSRIEDPGKRNETVAACHLLKAVEAWTDLGFGNFALWYVRDKRKREVDFLVSRDDKPWFLVEAKTSDRRPSDALVHFHGTLRTEHAFQLVFEAPHVKADCFARKAPVAVPARTLFSQLV